MECGHAVVGKHLKFSTVRCRKCNFVLIDVEVAACEVGLLLMFLVSMKAKVCLYHKYVSVLYLYSRKVSICFQDLQLGLRIQKSSFCMCVFIVFV